MNALHPSSARHRLAVKSEQLYVQTLAAIEDNNWEKLKNAIKLGMPLYAEIDAILKSHYTFKIKQATSNHDEENAMDYFISLVISGIKVLLMTSLKASITTKKEAVRQTFSEYLVIHPFFTKLDRHHANQVMQNFREALSLTNNPSKYKVAVQHINAILAPLVKRV